MPQSFIYILVPYCQCNEGYAICPECGEPAVNVKYPVESEHEPS